MKTSTFLLSHYYSTVLYVFKKVNGITYRKHVLKEQILPDTNMYLEPSCIMYNLINVVIEKTLAHFLD